MPTLSEIALATILILILVAMAILLLPAIGPVKRALRHDDTDVEGTTEAMGEPQGGANDAAVPAGSGKALVPVVEEPEPILTGALGAAAADPTLEGRVIRIVSWAFLMAVAVFAAGSGLWANVLPALSLASMSSALACRRLAISSSRQRVSTSFFTSSSLRSRDGVMPVTSNQR